MNSIIGLDQKIFLVLNGLRHPELDGFMLAATDFKFWIPFYLWFIFILFKKYDQQAWLALGCIAITILITDQLTSGILKPLTQRLRPSHEPALDGLVNLVKTTAGQFYKGGKYGFPSSHAANSFGVATFLWLVLRKSYRWTFLGFIVAFILTYTRLYLGVHYPSDLICGIAIGIFAGYAGWKLFEWTGKKIKTATEKVELI